jgi:hypothetical protein
VSRSYIPRRLRRHVADQARHRCGYCLLEERYLGFALEIEHIVPEALGGLTSEENLWLACSECNNRKGDRIAAIDPITGRSAPLFNPRQQVWAEHFAWSERGDRMIGRSPTGRATIAALNLNGPMRVDARRFWVAAGWHPPAD